MVPVSVFQLLSDAGQLIGSIKSSEVQTITDALGSGFANTGQALRNITVAARHLIAALQAAQAATVTLINSGGSVLVDGAGIERRHHLVQPVARHHHRTALGVERRHRGRPRQRGPDRTGGPAVRRSRTAPRSIQLIKELDGLSDVAIAQQPAVVSLLQQLPGFVNKIADTASGGSVAVNIYYNTKNSVCPYLSGAQTPEPTAATGAPDLMRTCTLQAPDLLQRGAARSTPILGRLEACRKRPSWKLRESRGSGRDGGAPVEGEAGARQRPAHRAGGPGGEQRDPSARRRFGIVEAVGLSSSSGLAVALIISQVQLSNQDSLNADRTSAVAAAKADAIDVATYSYLHLHRDFGRVEAESTPSFRRSFIRSSDSLSKVLVQYKATASAKVLTAAVAVDQLRRRSCCCS